MEGELSIELTAYILVRNGYYLTSFKNNIQISTLTEIF